MCAEQLSDYQLRRYCRQIAYEGLGLAGQKKLSAGKVCVVGCGGLGCTIGQLLVRAGLGRVMICDPEKVELENLHRQILFDERDLQAGRSKVEAARDKLSAINSQVQIETAMVEVTEDNICDLVGDSDIIIDATDNLAARYVINSASVKLGLPWVYGGCVGAEGLVCLLVPGRGPCLVCLFGQGGQGQELGSCQSMGILNSLPVMIGAIQVAEAIKVLVGQEQRSGRLLKIDLWAGRIRYVQCGPRDPHCAVCGPDR